jgi:hypothetical protein
LLKAESIFSLSPEDAGGFLVCSNIFERELEILTMNENSTAPETTILTSTSQANTLETTENGENGNQPNGRQKSLKNVDEKKQKEMEMAKEYQKVTRSLAREISKKDGFSLVTQNENTNGEAKAAPVTSIAEEPAAEEPQDGFLTETTFKTATSLLLAMEVR